ncbi:MAG: response regulator [Bacteroidales bacterium]|nr:response regulator [Bacteroidales bacterium]
MQTEQKTILLVDDDVDYLYQTRLKVESFGFKVITADTQKEAEELIENIRPDLAILDLMMENDDSGFILSYKIKKKYPDVPIIIATAATAETGINFDINEDENKHWIKADTYLDKGIRTDQLQREINRMLKL